MATITLRRAPDYVAGREAFQITTGAMRGVEGPVSHFGQLPEAVIARYRAVREDIEYTVMSYATPIAWFAGDGWIIPEVKYSRTTSRHQGIVRQVARLREGGRRAAAVYLANTASRMHAEETSEAAVLPPSARVIANIDRAIAQAEGESRDLQRWERHSVDDFAPDNGAPVERFSYEMPRCSGEGALYSLEYLQTQYGRSTS